MFSWAASLLVPGFCYAAVGGIDDVYASVQLSPVEQTVWKTVQPSILVLNQGGVSRGSAACIDADGFFLAHQNSVGAGPIDGVAQTGQTFAMRLVAQDKPTGLVLLHIDTDPAPRFPVIQVANEEHARRATLLAVLGNGPVRADIGHSDIVATYAATSQSLLINEIRFAAPPQMLTGALLFDDRGRLVGVLGATLPKAQSVAKASVKRNNSEVFANRGASQGGGQGGGQGDARGGTFGGQGGVQGGFGGGGSQSGGQAIDSAKANVNQLGAVRQASQLGPADLNVAYAVSPLLLNRVVTGFLSPTHEVLHPALGAVCSDDVVNGESEGVVIRRISRGSGADKAGLRVGDILLNIEGTEIHNVVDYARIMLQQEVGHRITLAVRRGALTMPIDAVVGRVSDPAQLQQELNQSGK